MCSMPVGDHIPSVQGVRLIHMFVDKNSMISYFSMHFTSKSRTFQHMEWHPDSLGRQWSNFADLFSTVIATRIHLSWSDLRKKCFFGTPLLFIRSIHKKIALQDEKCYLMRRINLILAFHIDFYVPQRCWYEEKYNTMQQ